jgi:hypothetical protein
MNNKWKVIVIALITALALSIIPLAAQTSNTARATAGIFGTDVDDYMSVHWYSGVEFDKYFGFTGYGTNNGWGSIGIGYARNFGGIYLGGYYEGNIANTYGYKWDGSNWTTDNQGGNQEIETIDAVYDNQNKLVSKITTKSTGGNQLDSRNDVSILLGVIGMGFKLGFSEDVTTRDTPIGHTTTTEEYFSQQLEIYTNKLDTYSYIKGDLTPSLAWGMGLDVGSLSIRPVVDIAFGIHRENENRITKSYVVNKADGTIVGNDVSNSNGQNSNYLAPAFTVGADVTFLKRGGLEAIAGLKYGIDFNIYSNSYDVFGLSGDVAGDVTWSSASLTIEDTATYDRETKTAYLNITEKTEINNVITPSFTITKEIDDRLKIGFSTEIGIAFSSFSDKNHQEYRNEAYTTYKNGVPSGTQESRTLSVSNQTLTETSTFGISPSFSAGLVYQVVPQKFNVNAGVGANFGFESKATRVTPQGYGYTKTYTKDQYGNITSPDLISNVSSSQTDSLSVTQGWRGLEGAVGAGFTFFFNPKFSLDSAFNTPFYNGFNVNLSSIRVLFTLKN